MAANVNSDTTVPPSTPAPDVFSDDATRPGTPPSSPPAFPWELKDQSAAKDALKENTPPSRPAVMNVFSVLGKRKALEETTRNTRPSNKKLTSKKSSVKENGLTQTQMNLGQSIQTTCKQCGMEYVLSSAEDRSLHAKFHKQNSEGVEVGAAFVDGTMKETRFAGVTGRSADAVILVDSSDRKARTKKSQAVLEVVQRELGAVPIPEAELWERPKEAGSEWEPKYHSYLYIRGGKCIGYLLTQRIAEAFAVIIPPQAQTVPPDKRTKAGEDEDTSALARLKARRIAKEKERLHLEDAARQPIVLSTTKVAAVLGVSRIWTSPMHRGQGIALALLDTAVERHNSQLDPNGADATTSASKSTSRMTRIRDKRQVAFSQPTESGAKLARKWTGKSFGWSVYVD